MYLLCDLCDDGCRGSLLNVEDDDLADDFTRHGWAAALDFACRQRAVKETPIIRVFRALRLITESAAAKGFALIAATAVSGDLFIINTRQQVAASNWAINRQVVAR